MFIELLLLFQQRHTHRATYNTDTEIYPYTEHNFTQYRDIYRDIPTYNNQLLQCRDIPAHSAEIQRSIQRIKEVHRDIEKHTTE